MSHFVALVIVPKETEDIKQKVEELLAPYDENLEVNPYNRECYCVGSLAKAYSYQEAEKVKSINDYRKEYWNLPENETPNWEEFINT
ncbi:hypothetical protein L1765_11280 [Microaerobacter geothermalis]|uniref:hypothetical protein n=1 Tax=Microaerobacter geothermalis TaxID=674972 RepID=UPI001F3A2EF4|nr:hypothetical protein [Microaerobacter geothermalis]MCF6094545.1 hypothetical protein [Microaerobacter geothermalis]